MPVGNRSPLYAGASSKCLLAFSTPDFIENYLEAVEFRPLTDHTITTADKITEELAHIRQQGYAMSLGERSIGLGSLSAPVLDHRGLILAAVSLAIPEIRYQDEIHREFCLNELLGITQKLSERMGFGSHEE